MNLRRITLSLTTLLLTVAAMAQQPTNTINKDSLPDDAIIVKRVPLESGPEFNATDVLVVDTLPSSSEGLNIVLYNDNTWRYVRNRDVNVLDETIYTQNWDTTKIQVYTTELKDIPISMVIDLVDGYRLGRHTQELSLPIQGSCNIEIWPSPPPNPPGYRHRP